MQPTTTRFTFHTSRQVPRLGVMLVGWGGNNGSTLTAAVLANRLRLTWPTRMGRKVGAVAAGRGWEGPPPGAGPREAVWVTRHHPHHNQLGSRGGGGVACGVTGSP